ncbi:MAG: DUF2065 domain-containing protein [Rhodospirillales bacterium]|nr:DUF2065 domain-containing protein [Rhodospirillales bacterium]
MTDLLAALGLAIAIEGVIYALFPGAMKNFMAQVLAQPVSYLRRGGLIAAIVGVFVVWLARGI